MENQLILQQFAEIEEKVERLISERAELETANLKLEQRIAELEEELQQKVQTENMVAEERALIRSKVDGLLAKLGDRMNKEA